MIPWSSAYLKMVLLVYFAEEIYLVLIRFRSRSFIAKKMDVWGLEIAEFTQDSSKKNIALWFKAHRIQRYDFPSSISNNKSTILVLATYYTRLQKLNMNKIL